MNMHVPPRPGLWLTLALLAILSIATWARFQGIDFGLPSMYDRDEPLFVMKGLYLLREGTFNPAWFGHPATTTIYALAIIDVALIGLGHVLGWWGDTAGFARAIYANPGLVFLPNRWFIAACGVACVALTYVLGRKLAGHRVGLLAAALLAICPLHIEYSQIIRTDMHATVFMLACLIFTVDIAEHGRRRDYALVAIMAGLAVATKWPAGLIIVAPLATVLLMPGVDLRRRLLNCFALGAGCLVTLFVVSPFLLLDYQTVLTNLAGESRPVHLGATGGGILSNMAWYITDPLSRTFGWAGVLLSLGGMIFAAVRLPQTRAALVLPSVAFFILISSQSLVWARWTVPLLPLAALSIAIVIAAIATALPGRLARGAVPAALIALLILPMAVTAREQAAERRNDTRRQAVEWARTHIPRSQSVVLETLLFEMLHDGWRFRYPIGALGCVDVDAMLDRRIDYELVERAQRGRAMINLGTIDPKKVATCRADYAIITERDRYAAEASGWDAQLSIYDALLVDAKQVALFKPRRGAVGGPVVRIFRLPPA